MKDILAACFRGSDIVRQNMRQWCVTFMQDLLVALFQLMCIIISSSMALWFAFLQGVSAYFVN
jgi:hypothetical protein